MTLDELDEMISVYLRGHERIAEIGNDDHGGIGVLDIDGDRYWITVEEL